MYVCNEPETRISINFIVPSVNPFSCSNFDKLKLSENYLDNLDKIKNIIYYLDQGCPTQLHHWAKIFIPILKRAAD